MAPIQACDDDWERFEAGQSCMDDTFELFTTLDILGERNLPEADRLPLILFLLRVAYYALEERSIPNELEIQAEKKGLYGPLWLAERLKGRWQRIVKSMRASGDTHDAQRVKHRMHYCRAQLTILAIQLATRDAGSCHDYFERKQKAATLDTYARYLSDEKLIDTLDYESKLKKWIPKYQVMKMGREIEAEIKKGRHFRKRMHAPKSISRAMRGVRPRRPFISSAIDLIHDLTEEDDGCARSQLRILGEIAENEKCVAPKSLLLRKCLAFRSALESVSKIEELQEDEEKFFILKKATWWARYFCLLFKMKKAMENKDRDAAKASSLQADRNELRLYLINIHVTNHEAAFGEAWRLERSYFGCVD